MFMLIKMQLKKLITEKICILQSENIITIIQYQDANQSNSTDYISNSFLLFLRKPQKYGFAILTYTASVT